MDEHALSLNGDTVGVSDMADCEYLASLNPVDPRLRAQRLSKWRAAQVPQGECARVGRLARQVRRSAKDVVQEQRADPAVNHPWRSLVGGAKNEVRVHRTLGIIVNGQGRCDRIAYADDHVARGNALTVGLLLHSERSGHQ